MQKIDWHKRFQIQAQWTKELRQYLYAQLKIQDNQKILEVGCGTGVIIDDLRKSFRGLLFGLDNNYKFISQAQKLSPDVYFTIGDAIKLPYKSQYFTITLCHYFLLWIKEPLCVLEEMIRVTHTGGYIIACAEPDYGGRLDYPDEFKRLGHLQTIALHQQGATPEIGHCLRSLFKRSGLKYIETGVLGGRWRDLSSKAEWSSEWEIIESDLVNTIPKKELNQYKKLDYKYWKSGEKIQYVPTFYAFGQVP